MKATRYEHGTLIATPAGFARGVVESAVAHHRAKHRDVTLTPTLAILTVIAYLPFVAAVIVGFGIATWLAVGAGEFIIAIPTGLFTLWFVRIFIAGVWGLAVAAYFLATGQLVPRKQP